MKKGGDSREGTQGSQGAFPRTSAAARWLPWLALPYGIALVLLLARQSDVAGLLHDDGVYLSMARSIERGLGPVDGHMLEGARTSRFPPLYPATLALARTPLGVGSDGLDGVHRLVALNGAWLALALFAFLRWLLAWKSWWPPLALGAAALLFGSPFLLGLAQHLMSESFFLAELMVALLLAERAARWDAGRAPAIVAGLVAGLLAATRTAGVPVAIGLAAYVSRPELGAVVAGQVPARRWRNGLLFFGAAALPWLASMAWSAASRDVRIEESPLFGPPYLRLLLERWRELPWIAWVNLVRLGDGWLTLLAPSAPPASGTTSALVRGGIALAALSAITVATVRGRRGVEHFVLAPYVLALLVWPFPDLRFVVPVAGIALVALVEASGRAPRIESVGHIVWLDRSLGAGRVASGIAAAAFLALAAWNAPLTKKCFAASRDEAPLFFLEPVQLAPLRECATWLAASTPRSTPFASTLDPLFAALADRPGVSAWPNDLAYVESYFDRAAAWRRLYGGPPSPDALQRLFERAEQVLAEYRRLGVRHVVHVRAGSAGHPSFEAVLDHFLRSSRATSRSFELAFTSSDRSVEVWRFRPDAR
jgi:hypothetical protein